MRFRALLSFVLWIAAATAVGGQAPTTGTPSDSSAAEATRVDPGSPRAAITDFLTLTRRGDYPAAARFFPDATAERGAELARRLKIVLDRYLWIDLELLSPLALGDTADGLPRDRERIGAVRGPQGTDEQVQLRRVRSENGFAWVFSAATAERVDVWFDAMADHWLRSHVPLALQRPGPFGVEYWQWGLLVGLIPLAILLSYLAASITAMLLHRVTSKTTTTLDDAVIARTRGPVRAIWTAVLFRLLLEVIGLPLGVEQTVGLITRALSVVFVTWLLLRIIGALESAVPLSGWAAERAEMKAIAPLVGRIARVIAFALGAIAVVAQFGYSVATLIAGLGIGGIAIALASQKTLEHVFGSVAIGLDQPIRVGDWIKVSGVEGAVEQIGLRSTRIRTIERSLISIPNGQLAEQLTENLGLRERILLRATIGLEYGTSVTQLRAIRDDIEALLRAEPLVWPERVIVYFANFGAHSLDIDVMAWLQTTQIDEFRETRQALFFEIMGIVERHGCAFAFPTQTIHIAGAGPVPPAQT
jgi:MscS family membrane protein